MVQPVMGSAAPLGLLALAMTTACLMYVDMDLVEAEFKELVWGYAVWYGGVAQLVVGILELVKGNSFGGTAFSTYGCFWLGWASMWIKYKDGTLSGPHSFKHGEVFWFGSFGVVTFFFWLITLRKNLCLVTVFGLLTVTFFLLAGGVFNEGVQQVGGCFGLLTAIAAGYTAFAELIAIEWGSHKTPPGLSPLGASNAVTWEVLDKRITIDEEKDLLVADFTNLKVCSKCDISTIEAAMRGKALGAGRRVDAVVNYRGFRIAPDLVQAYQGMVKGLQRELYQSVSQWRVGALEDPSGHSPPGDSSAAGRAGSRLATIKECPEDLEI